MSQFAGWLAAGVVAAGTLGLPASAQGGQETATGAREPRNIVFIFTDDQAAGRNSAGHNTMDRWADRLQPAPSAHRIRYGEIQWRFLPGGG